MNSIESSGGVESRHAVSELNDPSGRQIGTRKSGQAARETTAARMRFETERDSHRLRGHSGISAPPAGLGAVIFSFSVGFLPLERGGLGEILSPNSLSVLERGT